MKGDDAERGEGGPLCPRPSPPRSAGHPKNLGARRPCPASLQDSRSPGPNDPVLSCVHPTLSRTLRTARGDTLGTAANLTLQGLRLRRASRTLTPPDLPNPTSLRAGHPVNTGSPGENTASRGRVCPSKQPAVGAHTHTHTHPRTRTHTHFLPRTSVLTNILFKSVCGT